MLFEILEHSEWLFMAIVDVLVENRCCQELCALRQSCGRIGAFIARDVPLYSHYIKYRRVVPFNMRKVIYSDSYTLKSIVEINGILRAYYNRSEYRYNRGQKLIVVSSGYPYDVKDIVQGDDIIYIYSFETPQWMFQHKNIFIIGGDETMIDNICMNQVA
jgi:hypothetical protein